MRAFQWLLTWLFPPKCVLCRGLLEKDEQDFCGACRRSLPLAMRKNQSISYIDRWTAVCYYEGVVRESLLRYKFSGKRSYASAYGRLLAAEIIRDLPGDFDCIGYIPVSRARRRRRGYDQAELLARATARELGREAVPVLRKIRNNRPQSGLGDAARRRANVTGAYRSVGEVAGKKILLLDDIITTGATLSEGARVLRSAGAVKVYGAAFACGKPKF